MKALMYNGPRDLAIVNIPEPNPASGQVKIKTKYVGICGSDIHGYTGESGRRIPPMIMGHEFSGIVVECGKGAVRFNKGDRVTVQPIMYCGICDFCKQGLNNICSNRKGLGTMDINGAFTEYICVNEKFVFPLAQSISDEAAAMMDPFAVVYRALKHIMPVEGRNVLIAGTGTIGLLLLKLIKFHNPKHIVVIDLSNYRLELAKKFGADITINPREKDISALLKEAGIRDSIDIAIECVGISATAQNTIEFVRNNGMVVWIGNAAKMISINMQHIVTREVVVKGSYGFTEQDFSDALHFLEQGNIIIEDLISKKISLEEAPLAFEEFTKGAGEAIKVLVDMDK